MRISKELQTDIRVATDSGGSSVIVEMMLGEQDVSKALGWPVEPFQAMHDFREGRIDFAKATLTFGDRVELAHRVPENRPDQALILNYSVWVKVRQIMFSKSMAGVYVFPSGDMVVTTYSGALTYKVRAAFIPV